MKLIKVVPKRQQVEEPPSRCNWHGDPTLWDLKPAPKRYGMLRGTCKKCGVFLGYVPEVIKPHGKKSKGEH